MEKILDDYNLRIEEVIEENNKIENPFIGWILIKSRIKTDYINIINKNSIPNYIVISPKEDCGWEDIKLGIMQIGNNINFFISIESLNTVWMEEEGRDYLIEILDQVCDSEEFKSRFFLENALNGLLGIQNFPYIDSPGVGIGGPYIKLDKPYCSDDISIDEQPIIATSPSFVPSTSININGSNKGNLTSYIDTNVKFKLS